MFVGPKYCLTSYFPILHLGELQTTYKCLTPNIDSPYCTMYTEQCTQDTSEVHTHPAQQASQYCRQELWCSFPSIFLLSRLNVPVMKTQRSCLVFFIDIYSLSESVHCPKIMQQIMQQNISGFSSHYPEQKPDIFR